MEAVLILKQESLRDQVLGILKSRVILGDFKPGEIYSSTVIAQELHVSSSPVREALLALVDLGLMQPVRNRGFRVCELDEAARNNIIAIRMLLEVPAMMQLADHPAALAPHRAEIETYLTAIETSAAQKDLVSYLAADRKFHLCLLDLLGNPRLTTMINMLRDQTLLVGLSKLYASVELMEEARSHRQIFAALLAGDHGTVERLMRIHMRANAGPEYPEGPAPLHLATASSPKGDTVA